MKIIRLNDWMIIYYKTTSSNVPQCYFVFSAMFTLISNSSQSAIRFPISNKGCLVISIVFVRGAEAPWMPCHSFSRFLPFEFFRPPRVRGFF
jgi:hypothetical protein